MRNDIIYLDYTRGPEYIPQVRNPQRAKALKKNLKRQKGTVNALKLQRAFDLADRLGAYAGELIIGLALLIGPLIMMGLICGPDIIP